MNKKGFTLIELLVVIAIIGILSSIAIVYLGDARNKANDAKVKSNITTAATQLELDRANGTNSNGDDFAAAADIVLIKAKLGTATDVCSGAVWNSDSNTDGTNVAFYSPLCSDAAIIFCADSQGFRGEVTAGPTEDTGTCPTS